MFTMKFILSLLFIIQLSNAYYFLAPIIRSPCVCINIVNPICGEDNVNYGNLCQAECAGTVSFKVNFKSIIKCYDISQKPKCSGPCPCPDPDQIPSGCSEYCVDSVGPLELPELPPECQGELSGEVDDDDEDAFIQVDISKC